MKPREYDKCFYYGQLPSSSYLRKKCLYFTRIVLLSYLLIDSCVQVDYPVTYARSLSTRASKYFTISPPLGAYSSTVQQNRVSRFDFRGGRFTTRRPSRLLLYIYLTTQKLGTVEPTSVSEIAPRLIPPLASHAASFVLYVLHQKLVNLNTSCQRDLQETSEPDSFLCVFYWKPETSEP